VSRLRALARSIKDLKLLIVDYIQLMTPEGKFNSRNDAVGSLSRGLKILAGELKVPVIALSQMNRGEDGKEYDRPSLNRLRDSGELEQDANKVIILWKTEELPDNVPQKIGWYVAKNRRGKTGTVISLFDGAHMKFTETDEQYVPKKKKGKFELND
jgi:replicative DNA helicase